MKMSWLRQVGGSLSSMTGQLSNLTKDILNEGTEESEDHETQLKMARMKIREMETLVSNHRSEIDRLQTLNSDLELKSKTAEFQVQSLKDKYKETIAEREREIAVLRERGEPEGGPSSNHLGYSHLGGRPRQRALSDGLDDHQEETFASEEDAFGSGVPGATAAAASGGYTSVSFDGEHSYRQAANSDGTGWVEHEELEDAGALKEEIEELRNLLSRQEETHHQELAALQHAHSQQLTALKRQLHEAAESERLRLTSEDGQLAQALEISQRRVSELEAWRSELERRMGPVSRHPALLEKMGAALEHNSPNDLEALLADCAVYMEAKQQMEDLRQTVTQFEAQRTELEERLKLQAHQHQQQLQQLQQSMTQSSTSNSLLDTGESLSQLSDLSNISVRSRQLEEHMRSLANQIESFEKQIEAIPTEGALTGAEPDSAETGNGAEMADEDAEMRALKAKLSAKQEAMRLLRSKKAQLRRGDRRHGRRNGAARQAGPGEGSEQADSSFLLEAVEEAEGKGRSADDVDDDEFGEFEEALRESTARDAATSPILFGPPIELIHARLADLEAQTAALDRLLHDAARETGLGGRPGDGLLGRAHALAQAAVHWAAERGRLSQRLAAVAAERDASRRDLLAEVETLKRENDRLVGDQMRNADEAAELGELRRRLTELLQPAGVGAPEEAGRLVGDLKEVLEALQADKEALAGQVYALREELTASDSVARREGAAAEVGAFRAELEESRATVAALDEENGQLQRLLAEMKARARAEEARLGEAVQGVRWENERLREEMGRLQSSREEEEEEARDLRRELDELQEENARLREERTLLRIEKERKEEATRHLEEEEEKDLQRKLEELEAENYRLREEGAFLRSEKEEKEKDLSRDMEELHTENARLQEEVALLRREKEEAEELRREDDRLQKEATPLRSDTDVDVEELLKENARLQEEASQLRREKEAEEEIRRENTRLQEAVPLRIDTERKEEMEELRREIARLQEEATQLRKEKEEAEELRSENALLAEEIVQVQEELTVLREKGWTMRGHTEQEDTAEAAEALAAVRRERDELRDRLRAAQDECRLLGGEVTSLSQRSSQLQAQVERATAQGAPAGPVEEDMSREAIRDLSQLVRDKETEIEALRSKNASLLAVLQASGAGSGGAVSDPAAAARLVEEKEALAAQVRAFQQDRAALVAALNQKHAESVGYHAEIQRLMAFVQAERPRWQAAQEEAAGLRKEQAAAAAQLRHAEQGLADLRQAHNELRVSHAALEQARQQLEAELAEARTARRPAVDALVDAEAEDGSPDRDTVPRLIREVDERQREAWTLRQQVERLTFELSESQIRVSDLTDEQQRVGRQLEDARMEVDGLRQQNALLATAATANVGGAAPAAEQEERPAAEAVNEEENAMPDGVSHLQRERDQLVMALQSKQADGERLRREYHQMCDKEGRLQGELQRLREHLIQVEDTYTQDVLVAEEREKELRDRLAEAELRLQTCDSAVQSANRVAASRAEDAERDVSRLRVERDAALAELANAQKELHQQMASVNNLQMVLEQFQREKDNLVSMETEHYLKQITQTKEDIAALRNALMEAENQLKEQTDAIEAARRITDEMYKKESRIAELEREMERRNLNLSELQGEIERLSSTSENKIDKVLMKNLLMSYFNTPTSKRQDALRVIAGLLQCTNEELERLGVDMRSGWFSRWLRPRHASGSGPAHDSALDHSFTQLFVSFLERESKPMPQFSLPTDQLVAEVQQQRSAASRPPPQAPQAPQAPPRAPAAAEPGPAHALLLPQATAPLPLLTSSPAGRVDARNALLSILNPAPAMAPAPSAS